MVFRCTWCNPRQQHNHKCWFYEDYNVKFWLVLAYHMIAFTVPHVYFIIGGCGTGLVLSNCLSIPVQSICRVPFDETLICLEKLKSWNHQIYHWYKQLHYSQISMCIMLNSLRTDKCWLCIWLQQLIGFGGPDSSSFSGYELINVGVLDISCNPSLWVGWWAGLSHTLRFPSCRPGL